MTGSGGSHAISFQVPKQLPDTRVLRALATAAPFIKMKLRRDPFPPQGGGCTLPSPSEKPQASVSTQETDPRFPPGAGADANTSSEGWFGSPRSLPSPR